MRGRGSVREREIEGKMEREGIGWWEGGGRGEGRH